MTHYDSLNRWPLEQSCPAKVMVLMVVVASLDLLNIGHQVPHDGDQASIHVAAHPYGFGSLLNEFEEVVSVGLKSPVVLPGVYILTFISILVLIKNCHF